jgi:hypothetical protein
MVLFSKNALPGCQYHTQDTDFGTNDFVTGI